MPSSCNYQALWRHVVDTLPPWAERVERGLRDSLLQAQSDRWETGVNRGEAAEALSWLKARPGLLPQALVRAIVQRVKEELAPPVAPDRQARDFLLDSSPMLSLMDDQSVQEGIVTGRLTRQVDQACEGTLRELRSLGLTLPGRPMHEPELAYPLSPALLGESLSQALRDLGCATELRMAALQAAGAALVVEGRSLFDQHLAWLRQAGVQPQKPRLRSADELGGASYIGIDRLFSAPPEPPPAPVLPGVVTVGATAAQAGLAPPLVRKLEQLTRTLARQSHAGPAMEPVWRRLLAQVERLSADELGRLRQPDHPFWRLLDRLAALSAVHSPGDPEMRELASRLGPMLAQLEQPAAPSLASFDTALSQLDSVPSDLGGTRPMELESAFDQAARRQQVEPTVRAQLLEQLRQTPVPDILRQFLLGPWHQVLSGVLVKDGTGSASTLRYMNLVGDLLAAVARLRRGTVPSPLERQSLLDTARDGMAGAALPVHVVDGYLADLSRVLSGVDKIALAQAVAPSEPEVITEVPGLAALSGEEWQGHAELPTVPVPLDEDDGGRAELEAWVQGLKAGDLCRVMLQGRWVTALLNWRSDNGQFYMFRSRVGSGTHTLTRQALTRLRSEGLATRIEPGQLLARALETMLPQDS